jgi:hypothetical protein
MLDSPLMEKQVLLEGTKRNPEKQTEQEVRFEQA